MHILAGNQVWDSMLNPLTLSISQQIPMSVQAPLARTQELAPILWINIPAHAQQDTQGLTVRPVSNSIQSNQIQILIMYFMKRYTTVETESFFIEIMRDLDVEALRGLQTQRIIKYFKWSLKILLNQSRCAHSFSYKLVNDELLTWREGQIK